jgi:conjugal transfer pilus assembly protein TraB
MGKNGIKGEVVMRNGKILGWAWGQGLLTGLVRGLSELRSQRLVWVQPPLAPVMS